MKVRGLESHPMGMYLCDPADRGQPRRLKTPLRWRCPYPECTATFMRTPHSMLNSTGRCGMHAMMTRKTAARGAAAPFDPMVFPFGTPNEVSVALRWSLVSSEVPVPIADVHARLEAAGVCPLPDPGALEAMRTAIHQHAEREWGREAARCGVALSADPRAGIHTMLLLTDLWEVPHRDSKRQKQNQTMQTKQATTNETASPPPPPQQLTPTDEAALVMAEQPSSTQPPAATPPTAPINTALFTVSPAYLVSLEQHSFYAGQQAALAELMGMREAFCVCVCVFVCVRVFVCMRVHVHVCVCRHT